MNRVRAGCLTVLALASSAARAHGFGQRFDLPLPLWLWLTGAGATLLITFAAVGHFARSTSFGATAWKVDLPGLRGLVHPALVATLRWAAVALFVLTVAAGAFGTSDPYRNLITTMVWIVWWVGCAFTCALIGDAWALLNPLSTLFAAFESAWSKATRGRPLSMNRRYPAWLGAWPAVLWFALFAWAELVWSDKDIPSALTAAVVAYSVSTWLGMLVYGRDTWLRHGEAFAIAFGVLARFAPLEYVPAAVGRGAGLRLRAPGGGLMETVSWSMMVFVLTMLASVTFDGFKEIPAMQRLDLALHSIRPVALLLFELSEHGIDEAQAVATVMLVAFPAAFVALFWLANDASRRLAGEAGAALTSSEVARSFVLTLVPIAVAYHLAHYASLLLTTGQFIIPLASDPFGLGWNLFGTAGYKIDLAIVSPYAFWYGAVALIVVGHVMAVLLAHATALRLFHRRGPALRSQLPMLALMVLYTTLSLWILAQPIVG